MATVRRAEASWEGDLFSGKGVVHTTTSGVLRDLEVTWPSRAEEPSGRTSPEELIAAAHAACFSMALANGLAKGGHPPRRLEVSAAVTFDPPNVKSSALEVRGWVPGIDEAAFQRAAEEAKDNCPVSKALKGNVQLSVRATLVG